MGYALAIECFCRLPVGFFHLDKIVVLSLNDSFPSICDSSKKIVNQTAENDRL